MVSKPITLYSALTPPVSGRPPAAGPLHRLVGGYTLSTAFLMESNKNDIAHFAPTLRSPPGVVFEGSIFTATIFFLSSTAFPISHATHLLLCVCFPTRQRKTVASLIFADMARFIA